MKHLKSSFQDLHRIFERSITVRDIAAPLASFDHDYPAEKARAFMEDRDFDVVGVRSEGSIQGYVVRENLGSGTMGDHLVSMTEDDILRESDSLLLALESLRERRWTFVRFLGDPSGIVTRGDLQKAPMRMWLFGLISLLEMQMLRSIRSQEEDSDWWRKLLTDQRITDAEKVFRLRKERNEAIGLVDCLQIGDKATIFRKTEGLFELTGCRSKRAWSDLAKYVEPLRNKLAHANALESDSWPKIAETAIEVERILKNLEAGANTPA